MSIKYAESAPSLYQIQVMSVPFPYPRVKRAIFQFTWAPTTSSVCVEPTPGHTPLDFKPWNRITWVLLNSRSPGCGEEGQTCIFFKNSPKRLWWSARVKVNKVCEYLLLIPQEETWETLWSDSTDFRLYVKLKLLIEQAQFIFSSEQPLVPPRL